MRGDWLQLGIEPTTDIALIRRAYALKLRKTRPDDDAEAYQQLRSAYDRVLAAARDAAPVDEENMPDSVLAPVSAIEPPPAAPPAAVHFPAYGGGGIDVPVPRVVYHRATRDESDQALDGDAEAARRSRESRKSRQELRSEQSRQLRESEEAERLRCLRESDESRESRESRQKMRSEQSRQSRESEEAQRQRRWHESNESRESRQVLELLPFDAESDSTDASPDSVDSLAAEWQSTRGGAEGMALAWPGIALRLDQLPLATHGQASRVFADIVLATPELPPSCMAQMREHFDWSGDFRAERLLGAARAAALNALLDDVAPKPITDPQVLKAYRHLMLLSRLLAQGDYLRAALLSALVGKPMQRLAERADPAVLLRLGGDLLLGLRRMSRVGVALRLVAWIGGMSVTALCLGADPNDLGQGLVAAMFFLYGWFLLRVCVHWGHSMLRGPRRDGLARWLMSPRMQRAGPAVGNAMVVLAAGLLRWMAIDASMPPELMLVGFGLAFVGTILAWPVERDDALLCALIGFGLGVLGWGLFGFSWCLVAAWLLQRIGVDQAIVLLREPMLRAGQRSVSALAAGRSIAGLVLALPLVAMITARRMGMAIVLAALAVPVVLRQVPGLPHVTGWSVLLIVPVALGVLILVQVGAVRWVDRGLLREGQGWH